jgi:hypothetical protein
MSDQWFKTRGVVLTPGDITTFEWPASAHAAGLTTIATHVTPRQIAAFVATEQGQAFLAECKAIGLEVEHELHAMSDLLPRELFERDPSMFRMNEAGDRVPDSNVCVHSESALQVVCENALLYSEKLPSTTGRYFYWTDDGQPMCRCPECRGLSDSEQALLLENRVLAALRTRIPEATLAHLVYATTLAAPTQVKPEPGVFLEFAPISRLYDRPFRQREGGWPDHPSHGELQDRLDENLEVFPKETAQVLEYWLDQSRFAGWNRETAKPIPWHDDVFRDDLGFYRSKGIRHITTFAVWVDGDYLARFGEPPLREYGAGLAEG